jgi:hypothetical protein
MRTNLNSTSIATRMCAPRYTLVHFLSLLPVVFVFLNQHDAFQTAKQQAAARRLREDFGDFRLNPQRFTCHLTTLHLVDDDEN